MGEFLPDEAKDNIDPEYIKELETLGNDAECCYLIPILKGSEQRVGTCSFMPMEGGKVYDIAYCVHKNFQCRGYTTEIALGMIDYARCNGAEKVTIRVSKENLPSNRVAIKCGGMIARMGTYISKKGRESKWMNMCTK